MRATKSSEYGVDVGGEARRRFDRKDTGRAGASVPGPLNPPHRASSLATQQNAVAYTLYLLQANATRDTNANPPLPCHAMQKEIALDAVYIFAGMFMK